MKKFRRPWSVLNSGKTQSVGVRPATDAYVPQITSQKCWPCHKPQEAAFINNGRLQIFALPLLFYLCCTPSQGAIVCLGLSPETSTSGSWAQGELIEIVMQISVTAQAGQGFSAADFWGSGRGISVDSDYLKIHDLLFESEQVDTEELATLYDNSGGYVKSDDTWWYNPFTDFIGTVDFSPEGDLLEAIVGAPPEAGFDLGLSGAVNYLHLVLEVQSGLADPWMSTEVTFTGQLGSYDLAGPNQVDIFGTVSEPGVDAGSGSFSIVSNGFFGGGILSIIKSNWGLTDASRAQGDLTGDGLVGGADYNEVIGRWGEGSPPEAIPEPYVGLILLAAPLIWHGKQRW